MVTQMHQPYGYKTLVFGPMIIYSGKVRVKCDLTKVLNHFNDLTPPNIYEGKAPGITIIRWAVTNPVQDHELRKCMNKLLASIMHERIALKYGETVSPDLEYVCDVKPAELDF